MKSILLVEDSKFLRAANERFLVKAGFRVISINDGEEALRVAQEQPIDLILLDMLLPKLGGEQVLQTLKTNPATAHIPVIVLSSLPRSNRAKLIADGAVGYFEKSQLMVGDGSKNLIHAIRDALKATMGH